MIDQYEKLALRLNESQLSANELLSPYTTFRIGGPADLFYSTRTAEIWQRQCWPLASCTFRTSCSDLAPTSLSATRDSAGSSSEITRAISASPTTESSGWRAVRSWRPHSRSGGRGWSGLEHYVGIPSTVGGAVWQNLHFLEPAPERERTMFIAEVFRFLRITYRRG